MKNKKGINIRINRGDDAKSRVRIISDALAAVIVTASFWLMIYHGLRLGDSDKLWITGGLPVLADKLMDRITELTLKIHMGYEGKNSVIDTVFTPIMIFVTAAAAYAGVRFGNPVILILFEAAGAAGVLSGIIPLNIYTVLFFAALTAAFFYKAYKSGACRKHNRNAGIFTGSTAVLAVVLALLTALTGVGGMLNMEELSEKADRYMHEQKYEKYKNPMPEGNLSEAGSFDPGTGQALEVSEAKWETTYLKGFVGEVYDGKSWKRRKDSTVSEDADLFYWLHQNGFYGQTQLGSCYQVSGTEAEGFVSVTNMRACRNYCYVPYGASVQDEQFLDKKDIGDLNITTDDAAKSSEYIYSVVTGAADGSRSLQRQVRDRDASQDPEIKEYLDREETYRKTIRKRYLDVPDKLKGTLAQCLGKQQTMKPADAMAKILEFMNANVSYSEKSPKSGDDDFVIKFLADTKKGYAIQYASAAVMMLRYLGVPARYAEGFIIPDTLYNGTPDMNSIVVPMQYSHAWAEYYLDGVGWLPFETVPKYQNSGKDGVDSENTAGADSQEQKQRNDKKKIDNPMNRHGTIFKLNVPLLVAIGIAFLLILLIIFIMRRRKLARFIGTFKGKDVNLGAMNAFAYSIMLLKAAGVKINNTLLRETLSGNDVDQATKEELSKSIVINEQAKYGGRKLTEDQRKEVLGFKDMCLRIYKEKRTKPKMLWDRVVRCIY